MKICLTVLYVKPFWIGVFERTFDGLYEVAKITFGAEPKDFEIYEFVLNKYDLLSFSKPLPDEEHVKKKINPKRLQRQVRDEVENTGLGTKAQRALKLAMERHKLEKKTRAKAKKEKDKQRKFQLRQAKKQAKKRGH